MDGMSVVPERFPTSDRSRWMLVGLVAMAFAALATIAIVDEPALLRIDRPLQWWVIGLRQEWIDRVMWGITFLGTRWFIGAAVLALAIWTFLTGRCRVALLVLVLAFAFNPAIEWALKAGVDRVRPSLLPLGPGRGPSFPSGHVLASVGFYGLLPMLVPTFGSASRARIVAAMVGVASILTIGFSRVYIGVHWFTDVVGGLLIGSVLVAATYAALRGHRLHGCSRGRCATRS
jgi:undecaprenyl-diphosphatase